MLEEFSVSLIVFINYSWFFPWVATLTFWADIIRIVVAATNIHLFNM